MPNASLAGAVLERIVTHPEQHDQSGWCHGVDELAPDAEPPCGTTLCVGGWAAHLFGYTLLNGMFAIKDGITRTIRSAAVHALDITKHDAERLFCGDLRPEQVIAALDQLADGAPHIDWKTAYAAAYTLADLDASDRAKSEARRRVWPLTHDLYINGTRSGARGITATAMRVLVAGWEDNHDRGGKPECWRDERGIWTTASGRRYVPRLADAAVVYPGNVHGSSHARRVTGDLTWVAPLGNHHLHYVIVPTDNLTELAASPHIQTADTPAPDAVYSYLGTSWPPLAGDACQRCRTVAFLTRATAWPDRPAFCPDCHQTLQTPQASAEHAADCTQEADHTGLCTP